MDDLISRQAAIEAMMAEVDDKDRPNVELRWWNMGLTRASKILEQLPSAEPYNLDEWCDDCKEYDQEKHCCPRFNRVIRTAMEEAMKETKGEAE